MEDTIEKIKNSSTEELNQELKESGIKFKSNNLDELKYPNNYTPFLLCDLCYHAGLFNCGHPRNWVKPFRYNEICTLFKTLPHGQLRPKVSNYLKCTFCGKETHVDDLIAKNKGAQFLCKGCIK